MSMATYPLQEPDLPRRQSEKHDVPRRDLMTSLMGFGPIPLRWLAIVFALVTEQWRIGIQRPADRLTNMEALAASWGVRSAERIRDKGVGQLAKLAAQIGKLSTVLATLRATLAALDHEPVISIHGGLLTVAEAEKRLAAIQSVVTAQADDGSLKHRRVPKWLHKLAPWATALDLPVLLYFVGQVFNVDFSGLASGSETAWGQSIIPLLTTVAFALFGTVVVAIGLHFFARDLRAYKDDNGHLALPGGSARSFPIIYLALSITVTLGAGALMAYRIVSESVAAGNGGVSALVVGLFFAVVMVMLNVVVFSVHYRDGSLDTDELGHLSEQLRQIRAAKRDTQAQIYKLVTERTELRQEATRLYDSTRNSMSEPLGAADQVRMLARSYHQGCGWESTIAAPEGQPPHGLMPPNAAVDTTVLDTLMDSLRAVDDSLAMPVPSKGLAVISKRRRS